MNDGIETRVKRLIAAQLGTSSDMEGGWTFAKDLGADSLDEIELLMAAEEEFNIEIPGGAIFGETATVQQAIDYIRARCGNAQINHLEAK